MNQSYKPQGYSSVSAYVVANGAQDVIDFLIKSFDARQVRRYDMPDGSIMHAEVQIDDTVVMIADGGGDNPAFRSGSTSTCLTWMRHTGGPPGAVVSPPVSPKRGEGVPPAGPGGKAPQGIPCG